MCNGFIPTDKRQNSKTRTKTVPNLVVCRISPPLTAGVAHTLATTFPSIHPCAGYEQGFCMYTEQVRTCSKMNPCARVSSFACAQEAEQVPKKLFLGEIPIYVDKRHKTKLAYAQINCYTYSM